MFLLLTMTGQVMAQSAALLVYKVWEKGSDPYISRILVTDDHVRLDEGSDGGDFTLLDRKAGVIYNVSPDDRSILVMAPEAGEPRREEALVLSMTDEPDEEAPKVAGKIPHRLELLANGERCATLTVVPGLMEPALEGLRDFRRVLARVQAASMAAMPQEMQTACELAMLVQAPTRSLDHGLPLSEESAGRVQLLLDYETAFDADGVLFELPKDYRRIRMSDLAGN
ncbi:MAG: UDP-2,3-diacylglucosamine hydrolase [Gammaproteobacteria bacterium]|nr:MAG: UDP-2,3-diacylglucosamine hydrolase [Gammaproteobacteria bacterium]